MKLSEYLDASKIDDTEFGVLIDRDRSTVYRLRTGRTLPDWPTIEAIATATNGAVTANDFMRAPLPGSNSREVA